MLLEFGNPHAKGKMDLITLYNKIYLKWIINLNVNPDTVNLLEECMGENFLCGFRLVKDFIDTTPKV